MKIFFIVPVYNDEKSLVKLIQEIKEAANFALQSPFPKQEDLYTDVYL